MLLAFQKFGRDTFSSLKVYNFRLYFIGQIISSSGTWMQGVAQSWLVLQLTNSGTALGIVSAMQFFPILFLGPFGGMIADKFSKRKILYVTQTASGLLGISLGLLVLTGHVQLWMIYLLALLLGLINTVDIPTRQTFIAEMVGEDELKNAVTLNSVLMNLSRVIGPTIAGIIIVTAGVGACFIFNGVSFFAVVAVLLMMSSEDLHRAVRKKERGPLFEGFYYILSRPILKVTLIMMAIIGTLTYEFSVSLALLAQKTFHGDARSFAALTAAVGIGSVVGGMISAGSKKVTSRVLIFSAFFFGIFLTGAALSSSLAMSITLLVVAGFFSLIFMTTGNTIMQLGSEPELRGRVMAFWTMAFSGSTAVGGPIIGWIGQHIGPRWGLGTGGIAAITAAILAILMLREK